MEAEIPVWLIWLIAAVALILTDIFLLGLQFILVVVSLAALIAGGFSVFEVSVVEQLWIFIGSVFILVPVWICLFHSRFFKKAPGPREPGWEKGAEIQVVRQGSRIVGKLRSDSFPIRLLDGSEPREGEKLVVDHMEGITLMVYRPEND